MEIKCVFDFLREIESTGGLRFIPSSENGEVLNILDLTHKDWEKIGTVEKSIYESACQAGYLNTVSKKRGYMTTHVCVRASSAGNKYLAEMRRRESQDKKTSDLETAATLK